MKNGTDYKLRDKRTWVKGILVECPLGTALESCPAAKIRDLPLPQLLAVINGMSDERIDGILAYHERCLEQREAESG